MLDFFRDIFLAFRQASIERIKSPLLGAFVFSWLSFNWKVPAILIMSNEPIEKNIEFIDCNSGYFSFLIFPLIATIIICYALPRVNRFITKVQGEPNSETLKMQLTEKISVGGQQIDLAEIEARKELAKTKVEKEIDKNIDLIIEQNKNLISDLKNSEVEIEKHKDSINEITVSRDTLINTQKADKELIEKLHKEIEKKDSENKTLSEQMNGLQLMHKELKINNENLNTLKNSTDITIKELTIQIERLNQINSSLKECFPNIFFEGSNAGNISTTPEALDKIMNIDNGEWKYKNALSTQHINKIALTEIREYFLAKNRLQS